MSNDSERQQDESEAMVAEGCERSINEGGSRMIYSWKVLVEGDYSICIAAEKLQVTDSGVIVFYVNGNVVYAFRKWVSVERLPSE